MLIFIIDFQAEGNLCLFEAGYYLSINLRLINILSRLRVVTKISFFGGGVVVVGVRFGLGVGEGMFWNRPFYSCGLSNLAFV